MMDDFGSGFFLAGVVWMMCCRSYASVGDVP